MPEYLRPSEFARRTGMPSANVARAMRTGRLPYVTRYGLRLIEARYVAEWSTPGQGARKRGPKGAQPQ